MALDIRFYKVFDRVLVKKHEAELVTQHVRVWSASLRVTAGTRQEGCCFGLYTKIQKEDAAVPPPYTRNFIPPTPDLSFTGLDKFVNELVVENRKSDEEVSKVVKKYDDAPIIEDWVSDSEEENVTQPKVEKKTVKPSFTKIEFVKPKGKTARKTAKQVEQLRQNTHTPRGNQRN
ncbi:hypothetical protein Tco_0855621 [Tanacetum coccineum]